MKSRDSLQLVEEPDIVFQVTLLQADHSSWHIRTNAGPSRINVPPNFGIPTQEQIQTVPMVAPRKVIIQPYFMALPLLFVCGVTQSLKPNVDFTRYIYSNDYWVGAAASQNLQVPAGVTAPNIQEFQIPINTKYWVLYAYSNGIIAGIDKLIFMNTWASNLNSIQTQVTFIGN